MKFTDKAMISPGGSGQPQLPINRDPKDRKPEERGQFSAGEVFIAGQMKYNPIVSFGRKIDDYLDAGLHTTEDDPNYDPYRKPENLAGYPLDIFRYSGSEKETDFLKSQYDRDHYLDQVSRESGAMGVASAVAGGAMNPLYLVPYIQIGQRMRYAKSIADAATGEVITEGLYKAADLDKMRTDSESVFNIAAGAIMGGILTGAVRRNMFTPGELKEIKTKLINELDHASNFMGPPAPTPVAKAGPISSLKDVPGIDRISGTFSRAMSKLSPIRTLASRSESTRKLAALLGEQNVKGTSRSAIETLVKQYDGYFAKGMVDMHGSFTKYRSRVGRSGSIARGEFNQEVAKAMRAGDEHVIPEVQEAARKIRRDLMDPVRVKAKEAGIYLSDEDVAKFSKGYFPRMYNFDKINANRAAFKAELAKYLKQQYPKFKDEEIVSAAAEIARSITHQFDTHHALAAHTTFTASSLKGRKVPVPDDLLEPWLVSDPDVVLRAWSHNLATEIELTRTFGDTNIDKFLREVEDEWDDIITETSKTDPKAAAKLTRQKNDDLVVLNALHQRLLNRYALPENHTSGMVRLSKFARNLNVLRLLGGMQLSALPDMARPLYHHHFSRYGKALKTMLFADPSIKKMLYADARRMGIAQDMVISQRMIAMVEADYLPNMGRNSWIDRLEYRIEKGVTGSTGGALSFGHLSLMSPWNAKVKMTTFLMSQDGLLAHTGQPIKHAKKLREAGISDDMARRIRAQYEQFGEKVDGSLRVGNSDKWTDLEAAEMFEATLMKEVDSTIITPGIMDKPLWTSTEVGKVLSQFKSFAFAATNRQFLNGMQNQSAMIYQGMLAAIALGSMTWAIKRRLAGYDDQEMSPEELVLRGIEYSGVIGMGSELLTMGTGVAHNMGLYKGEGNFRWAKQDLFGTLGGPSVGLASDFLRSGRYVFKEQPNAGDVEALRRLMPYQNLSYARWLFDMVEQQEKDRLGIME